MVFISAYNKRLLNLQLLSSNLLSTTKCFEKEKKRQCPHQWMAEPPHHKYSLPRGDSWPHTHHVNAWVIDKSQKIGSTLTVERHPAQTKQEK